jgi:two-component system nitrogen regulation sensor histidine kinase GlnL
VKGRRCQCNIHFAPLLRSDGQMLMLISPREMASRMTQNAGSQKAAKSAIGMAEMLAHEIKNPLAGIIGAAQLLAGGLSGDDLELTDLIVEESRRVVKLLEQVEQFGNVRPPALRPVNIHDVLDRARQSAAVGFGAHMRFVEDYDPSLPRTLADADQLLQVFLNLLKNACEAGREGGTIRLRSFYEPRCGCGEGRLQARLPLQVEVEDDGPGLPARHCGRCIRAIRVGARERDGAGLALVSKLRADVGGWISVESVPGRTVFRVSLPLAPKNAVEDAEGER